MDILTIGQYLRPSTQHLPLVKHHAPLVRSSCHAERQVPAKPA
jgi:lipoate synthase